MPVPLHRSVASLLAFLFCILPQRIPALRRVIIQENLNIAFGEQSPGERRRLVFNAYRHFVYFSLEVARLRYATPAEVISAVRLPHIGQEYSDPLLDSGKGFIIGCAHHGNWEWLGAWFSLTRGNFGVVYKPMHSPGANALSVALRERFGIKILSTRERTPRALFSMLRSTGVVAILADQDARREGRFIPFFGKPASTASGLASLAVRLGVPILPAFCLREAPCRFRIKVYPPLYPDPNAPDRDAEELRLMAGYLACVEDIARLAPEQYFWGHRRWKTRPKRRKAKPAKPAAGPAFMNVDPLLETAAPPFMTVDPLLAAMDPLLPVAEPPLTDVDPPLTDVDPPLTSTDPTLPAGA